MLKKEHISCKIVSPRIKPFQLPPDDPAALDGGAALLMVYQRALRENSPLSEIEKMTGFIISSAGDSKLLSGLNKLILDRCTFENSNASGLPERRRELFAASARELREGKLPGPADGDIYADLPGCEKLISLPELTPEDLIHRYNIAQAQGLIVHASELRLTVSDPDVANLRKVMKAVKFFRLLARFRNCGKKGVEITVSGPYSLFGPVTRYAFSLAALLPVAATLGKWTLEADVKYKNRELKLKLSEKSGFHSPVRSFSAYLPEEIKLYHRHFSQKASAWQIIGETPFLDAGDQEIIFPDLSFSEKNSGRVVHLELFHRWHASQLEKRLRLLRERPELPLILGIDRSLIASEAELDEKLADAPQLRQRCWLFRDFPGVENTLRVLKKFAPE